MQASCIIFTALCSVTILRRKLNALHLWAISAAVLGVLVVSYAGLLHAKNAAVLQHTRPEAAGVPDEGSAVPAHAARLVLGVSLTLASQFTQVCCYQLVVSGDHP